jgi:hypothetical protein
MVAANFFVNIGTSVAYSLWAIASGRSRSRTLRIDSLRNNLRSTRLYRLRKNSCFVSGHDFSRAVQGQQNQGFSPWAFSSGLVGKHRDAGNDLRTRISCGIRR